MECQANTALWIYPAKHGSDFECRGRDCLPTKTTLGKRSLPDMDAAGQLHCNTSSATKKNAVIGEQCRRNRMKDLCSKLESLFPTTMPKLDRCGLYEEASNYIRKLQEDLSQLKSQREALLAKQCGEAGKEKMEKVKVVVEIHGSEVVIGMSSMRKPRCIWRIMQELEEHHVDVNMSQLSRGEFFVYMNIHGRFREGSHLYVPARLRSSLQTGLQMAY